MLKVLVVDDEAEVADFLCNFLKRFKTTSHKAINGIMALEEYDRMKPDWMFLDIKMPDMDGFEVLSRLKEKDPDAKVIMITGSDDKEEQQKAKDLGAIDFIIKPIDLEELHAKIKTYILNDQT